MRDLGCDLGRPKELVVPTYHWRRIAQNEIASKAAAFVSSSGISMGTQACYDSDCDKPKLA